eukprot:CAMPEP_0116930812 /NCGR_PEP_ID=MMETSP0467-20121206/27425_1 /TAXON_ID=283647 /ORGANISM="Mesodinium pulex, Strain SPMC105" /LENGTH=48 /DNA_ID= /DNA_START= /DNA_END= /DNA_ORIENTATION=
MEHKHKFAMFPLRYEVFIKRMLNYHAKARPDLAACTQFFKDVIDNKLV